MCSMLSWFGCKFHLVCALMMLEGWSDILEVMLAAGMQMVLHCMLYLYLNV